MTLSRSFNTCVDKYIGDQFIISDTGLLEFPSISSSSTVVSI